MYCALNWNKEYIFKKYYLVTCIYNIHIFVTFTLFMPKVINAGCSCRANDPNPPSSTATWLERISESTSCMLVCGTIY